MRAVRELAGYLIGFLVFVIMIPLLMWKISGDVHPVTMQIICLTVLAVIGIGLSVWSIVYMKRVGQGNPMDAFNHEVAPRTINLMTDGPYRICRNPMLLGVFIYYIGFNLSIVTSYIRLEESKRSIKAYMKNPINKKDNINGNLSFEYEGSIGSDQKVAIITLRNDEVINKSFEKVMITITLKFTKDNYYLGSISALLDNQKPTVRKCILTKERLEGKQLEDIFKLLEISDEEYSQMKKDMFWNPETYAIEDYSTKVIK